LIGGASGVGKTSVSYRLARHYGVGITEIDDFQVILERMTTPDQYPVVHFFPNHPDGWHRMREEEKLEFAIGFAELMATALEPVIANRLRGGPPIVLEGDFLPPSLAVQSTYAGVPAAGRVKTIILYEADEEQIARNFRAREGQDQPERARSCWHYSEWLTQEARRLGVPAVPARPWDTVFERIIALLESLD
jgi:2-phosphoglycerate kinase